MMTEIVPHPEGGYTWRGCWFPASPGGLFFEPFVGSEPGADSGINQGSLSSSGALSPSETLSHPPTPHGSAGQGEPEPVPIDLSPADDGLLPEELPEERVSDEDKEEWTEIPVRTHNNRPTTGAGGALEVRLDLGSQGSCSQREKLGGRERVLASNTHTHTHTHTRARTHTHTHTHLHTRTG